MISYFNLDIIGLTEINKDTPLNNAQNFLNLLNSLDNSKNYNFIMSNNLQGRTASAGQAEKIIIFYNSKKVNLISNDILNLTYPNDLYELDKQTSQWTISNDNPIEPIDISL